MLISTLSQEEIRSILAERYEVSVDRKTLGRHLNDLYESGDFGIQCEVVCCGSRWHYSPYRFLHDSYF